jgi:DNA-directed RNA polymerase subunit RPC12/RpoP
VSQDNPNEMASESQAVEGEQAVEKIGRPPQRDAARVKGLAALAVIGALIVLALVVRYSIQTAGGEPQIASPYQCYDCGYVITMKVNPGVPIDTCPRCQKPTLRPAYKCAKCGTLVVLNEDRGLEPPTKCPKCGAEVRHGD